MSNRDLNDIFTVDEVIDFFRAVLLEGGGSFPSPRRRKIALLMCRDFLVSYGQIFEEIYKNIDGTNFGLQLSKDFRKLMFQRWKPEEEKAFQEHFQVLQSVYATGLRKKWGPFVNPDIRTST